MSDYAVHVAEPSEEDAVINTLLLAFATDPCTRYVYPTPAAYCGAFRRFAEAMGGGATRNGAAWMADDGAAAALWLPPGVQSDSGAIGALIDAFTPPERLPVLGQVVEGMAQFHPQTPHWYLAMLGVDPVRQGRGLGSALLEAGLARVDAEGALAYLESSNPKNVPLYERFGFEVIGLVQPEDFPPLIPMLRPARI